MLEVLKYLIITAGIIITSITIILLIVIVFETIRSLFDIYKKDKRAKHYFNDAEKIIERENDGERKD